MERAVRDLRLTHCLLGGGTTGTTQRSPKDVLEGMAEPSLRQIHFELAQIHEVAPFVRPSIGLCW
jgi:hypothetical protein